MLSLWTPLALAADPCVPRDLTVLEHEAREHLFAGDFEAALEPARQAEESLSCLEHFAHPGQMAGIFQVGAAAALELEQEALASRWYENARRLGPGEPFDADLADEEGRALWEAAGHRLDQAGHGEVHARGELRLDGWALEAGQRREVLVGEHLVQYLDEEGSVVSELCAVSPGRAQRAGLAPRPPLALVGGGAALSAVGLVALNLGVASAFRSGGAQYEGLEQSELDAQARRTNALVLGGSGAVALGTGLLTTGLLLPSRTSEVRPSDPEQE